MIHEKLELAEAPGIYKINGEVSEKDIFDIARSIAKKRFSEKKKITSPEMAKQYITPYLMNLEREEFVVVFMDTQHHVIKCETLFTGTIDSAQVFPREILKQALKVNAVAVILGHNHPSGDPSPSTSDIQMTKKVVQAFELMDMRVLDHIIVGDAKNISMAELDLVN